MPLVLPPAEPCSFCDYLAGRRLYTILERHDTAAILVTYEQRGRGHVLVVPVRHRATVIDLTPDEQVALMDGVVRATRAIIAAFDPEGVAVWQNNGIPANQSVPHVHVHVAGTLPEGGTEWGPVSRLAVADTDLIADRLRPHLTPAQPYVTDGRPAARQGPGRGRGALRRRHPGPSALQAGGQGWAG